MPHAQRTYIALFRGINVGGHNLLPMKALKLLLEANDCADVQTYVQSGNVMFRSSISDARRQAKTLTALVSKRYGFAPRVLVLTLAELESAAAGNPFPEADGNPKSLHLFFLAEQPKTAQLTLCEAVKTKTERFVLKGKVFYLLTPDGFGTSKLAARAEKLLGVDATARNWRTVTALLGLARSSS